MLHFMKQWHCTAFRVGLSLVGHLPTLTNLSKRCGVLAKVILVQCVVVTRVAQVGLLNTQHITSDTQMSWTAHQFLWQDVIAIFELASSHLSSTSHVSQWMSVYMYVCICICIHLSYLTYPGFARRPPKTLSWRYLAFAASQVRWKQVGSASPMECKAENVNAGDVCRRTKIKLIFQRYVGMSISTFIQAHSAGTHTNGIGMQTGSPTHRSVWPPSIV